MEQKVSAAKASPSNIRSRRLFGVNTWVYCCAAFLGGIAPDTGHGLNYFTHGAVDWGWFHNYSTFFAWLSASCLVGLVTTLFLGRVRR